MASPYQSQLFNFFNRQSLQWRDRAARAARHLKLAAEWSLQILIYPVYLLVQAGRLAGLKLEQRYRQAQLPPASAPPTADGAIAQVLQAVAAAELRVQGIASLLEDRQLVLVGPDNQTLAFLSPDQQRQLQQRIGAEVASYWYQRRWWPVTERKFPPAISSSARAGRSVVPPVRWFWRVMHWEQTHPIAAAVNLFGESTLPATPAQSLPASPPPGQPPPFLIRLDRQVAQWEREELAVTGALIQAALDDVFGGRQTPSQGSEPSQAGEPWLSWEDLFAKPGPPASRGGSPTGSEIAEFQPPNSAAGGRGRALPIPPSGSPPWIETEARAAGYVRHPLEKLLDWLDRFVLWLETVTASLWGKWRRRG